MSISSASTEWNKTHARITSCELYASTEETHQGIFSQEIVYTGFQGKFRMQNEQGGISFDSTT